MTVDEVRAILAEHREELAERGVLSLSVFGSVARGKARKRSDVDLIAEFGPHADYFDLFRLQRRLAEWLGCSAKKVHLFTPETLHPRIREQVLQEAIHIA
ncbi:MAG: nucleotidyltransferase family protein [Armatimonadetes bacterium]|nr:nucleotidyltransferase family protein [Armatimonadota bacterium]